MTLIFSHGLWTSPLKLIISKIIHNSISATRWFSPGQTSEYCIYYKTLACRVQSHCIKILHGSLIWASGFGGLERWNGMVEWTGLERWNGMEWNAESNWALRRMRVRYHACAVSLVRGGDGVRQQGIGALFCPVHELTAGIYSYFTPLGN